MSDTTPLNELLNSFAQCLDTESARRVLELEVPPEVQEKVELLAERANAGLAAQPELAMYEAMIDAADLIALLKLKARRQAVTGQRLTAR